LTKFWQGFFDKILTIFSAKFVLIFFFIFLSEYHYILSFFWFCIDTVWHRFYRSLNTASLYCSFPTFVRDYRMIAMVPIKSIMPLPLLGSVTADHWTIRFLLPLERTIVDCRCSRILRPESSVYQKTALTCHTVLLFLGIIQYVQCRVCQENFPIRHMSHEALNSVSLNYVSGARISMRLLKHIHATLFVIVLKYDRIKTNLSLLYCKCTYLFLLNYPKT
jgi:hypothetical protein